MSDCQSSARFLWGIIGTGLAGTEKSCTFALAKPRGVRSYGAPAEVGAEAMRGKEISGSLAGMKIFRTCALTAPPEGLGMLKKRS